MDGVTQSGVNPWPLLDLIGAFGLVMSVVVGVWRGLLKEVMALLGWFVAYVAAQWLGPVMALHVPVGESGSQINLLSGMLVAFVLAWITWALLSWALSQMLRESVLSGADRLLGAGFGLIRGVLVGLVLVTLLNMTPIARWDLWKTSRGVACLQVLLQGLRPVLPDQVVKFLPDQT